MTILSVLGPALHCEWNISRYQQALVTTVVFLGMMLSSTFWGSLSDRYGRKPVKIYFSCFACSLLIFHLYNFTGTHTLWNSIISLRIIKCCCTFTRLASIASWFSWFCNWLCSTECYTLCWIFANKTERQMRCSFRLLLGSWCLLWSRIGDGCCSKSWMEMAAWTVSCSALCFCLFNSGMKKNQTVILFTSYCQWFYGALCDAIEFMLWSKFSLKFTSITVVARKCTLSRLVRSKWQSFNDIGKCKKLWQSEWNVILNAAFDISDSKRQQKANATWKIGRWGDIKHPWKHQSSLKFLIKENYDFAVVHMDVLCLLLLWVGANGKLFGF